MRRPRRSRRRAALTVEFALVVPLVFLFFFAAFEFSRTNMIRQTAARAAYEGARSGLTPGAGTADVQQRVTSILDAVKIRNASVEVTSATIAPGTASISVTVSVPLNDNAWVTPKFLRDKVVRASHTAVCDRL